MNATILQRGAWYSVRDCPAPSNPRQSVRYGAPHRFVDIQRRESQNYGEVLVTSQCKYCGGLIVDCPTIGITEFSL